MASASQQPTDGPAPFIDFGDEEEVDLDEIKRKQDEEFDFTGMLQRSAAENKKQKKNAPKGTPTTSSFTVDVYVNPLTAK